MKKIYFVAILLLVYAYGNAQDGVGLRSGVNLQKKLTKKITLNANGQLRFNGDISYLQTYLFELGGAYKISKAFDAAIYYRFVNRRNQGI
jgi:hypothetical protein